LKGSAGIRVLQRGDESDATVGGEKFAASWRLRVAGERRGACCRFRPAARLREILAAFSFPEEPAAFYALLQHYQQSLIRVEGYSSHVPANHKLEALRACACKMVMAMRKNQEGGRIHMSTALRNDTGVLLSIAVIK
jgi:hypothetical protein